MFIYPSHQKHYVCVCIQSPSCVWLCNPVNCSTPALPDPHILLEFAQVHVHWISDAIQPSHPYIYIYIHIHIHTHTHTHTHSLIFFSIMVYHRIMSIVPCAVCTVGPFYYPLKHGILIPTQNLCNSLVLPVKIQFITKSQQVCHNIPNQHHFNEYVTPLISEFWTHLIFSMHLS